MRIVTAIFFVLLSILTLVGVIAIGNFLYYLHPLVGMSAGLIFFVYCGLKYGGSDSGDRSTDLDP